MRLCRDVVQSINPWTAIFSRIGIQLGVITCGPRRVRAR
jgi:hypothetical protein